MGNRFKRVVYVGIQVKQKEFLESMGFKDYDEFFDWCDKNGLNDLNGHKRVTGEFGCIYTDDYHVCIGQIIDASGENEPELTHVDLLREFHTIKFGVIETLRKHKICIGEIAIYATTLYY